jgi:hypothetical protein
MRSLGLLDTVVPLNATTASFDLRGTVPAGAPIVVKPGAKSGVLVISDR